MAEAVGVDGGAGVETRAALVVGEAASGLLDDQRWCCVIPQVTPEPDTCRDLALGDAALVALCPLGWSSTDNPFESLLLLGFE